MGKLWDLFRRRGYPEIPHYMRRDPIASSAPHYWGFQILEVVNGKVVRVLTMLDASRGGTPLDAPRAIVRTVSVQITLLLTAGVIYALPQYQKSNFEDIWEIFKDYKIQEW